MSGEYHVVRTSTCASPSRRWPQRYLSSAQASAQPLAMNDPGFFPFPGSIFQQVVREPAPQAYALLRRPIASSRAEENATEQPSGVERSASAARWWPTTPARRRARSSSIRRTPISITCSATAARSATASASAARASPGPARRRIARKQEWPDWHPPAEMIERQPYLPRFMAGGPGNPLGARAMYLGNTDVPHPRHQRAADHRPARVVGLHPSHQRKRQRPVRPRLGRRQGRGAADERPPSRRCPDAAQRAAPAPVRQRVSATYTNEAPRPVAVVNQPSPARPSLGYGSSASRLY